jgi:hypothetical protein
VSRRASSKVLRVRLHSLNPAIQCRNLLEPESLLFARKSPSTNNTRHIPTAFTSTRLLFGHSQHG